MMKLTLWQQFSSNHSTSHTIIGVFETPDAAQNAHAFFHQMLREIMAKRPQDEDAQEVSIQERYAQRYGVEWEYPVDWMSRFSPNQGSFQEQVEVHLVQFGTHLIVDSDGDSTLSASEQLQALLTAMGAVVHARIADAGLRFRLICTAPDTTVAQTVYAAFKSQLERPMIAASWWLTTPNAWAQQHPRFQTFLLSLTPAQYAAAEQAWQMWCDLLQREGYTGEDLWHGMLRLEEGAPLLAFMRLVWEETRLDEGMLTQEGLRIVFEEAEPDTNLLITLPALYHWLQTLGCHVTYEFLSGSKR
jgi:hypothetical protein